MPAFDFLTEIRNRLPIQDVKTTIKRLRLDPLIWGSLHDEEFAQRAMNTLGEAVNQWTPAALGRLAVGEGWADPRLWVLKPVEMAHANQLFDQAVRDHRVAVDLKEATYLAIALLDRWQKTENLQSLIDANAGEPAGVIASLWRTPLTCLYGMIDNPNSLIRALLSKKPGTLAMGWISHCLLCHPHPAETRVDILTNLLTGVSPAQQITWLRTLQLGGHAEVVSQVSRMLLAKTPQSVTTSLANHASEKFDLEMNVVRLVELMRLNMLYRYAGQVGNARAMAGKTGEILSHLNARQNLQDAELDVREGRDAEAVASLSQIIQDPVTGSMIKSEAIMALPLDHVAHPVVAEMADAAAHPILEIYRSKAQFEKGHVEQGRASAGKAATQLMDNLSKQPVAVVTQHLGDWAPCALIKVLRSMNLSLDALALAELLGQTRPCDADILEQAYEICFEQHQLRKAHDYALTLVAIEPEKAHHHRQAAQILEKMGFWQAAKEERARVVETDEQNSADWIALGRCCLQLNEFEDVLSISGRVLANEPENGKACALRGKALVALGRHDEAVKLLNQATLLAPEEAEPWLELARMQSESGEAQRSMETMKAAVLAVPDSAEVNHCLGRAFMRGGLFSDGLPYLRKAAILAPEVVDVTLDLGRTLTILGHPDEARSVFEQGRIRYPQHAELAFASAETALFFNDRTAAVEALEIALKKADAPLNWFILAAQTITHYEKDGTRPEPDANRLVTIQIGLEKGIHEQPQNIEAVLLRADVLMARGQFEQAYEAFQKLIEPAMHDANLSWRVQGGLGEAALHLEMMEPALVALKEAVQFDSENPRMYRLLAEAFLLGALEPDAKRTAQEALKLAPDCLEMLEWYAGFVAKMGESDEALRALGTATQLAPENAGLWVGMAELHTRSGDGQAAKSALGTALACQSLHIAQLRRIAKVHLDLGQPVLALDAMLRAQGLDESRNSVTWLELAYLFEINQRYDQAYESLRNLARYGEHNAWYSHYKADLLMKMGRYDEAKTCLMGYSSSSANQNGKMTLVSSLIPLAWQKSLQKDFAVEVRKVVLERRLGNLQEALACAEDALSEKPEVIELHILAADLACAMLLFPRAAQLAVVEPDVEDTASKGNSGALVNLWCLQAEIALENGDYESAGKFIEKAGEIDANLPRLIAINTRLAVQLGEWDQATRLYGVLANKIKQAGLPDYELIPGMEHEGGVQLWMAETALDMMDWRNAQRMAQQLVERFSREPRVIQNAVKTHVMGLEAADVCKDALVRLHAPEMSGGSAQPELLEKWLADLEGLTNTLVVERWRARGRAASLPSNQNLRLLADLLPADDEAAVLMSLLRKAQNLPAAIQIAQEYPNSAKVLTQLALCHLTVDPAQGLLAANRAAELESSHPIILAVLALTLQKNGFSAEAFDVWENALQIWDEPTWRAKAAHLANEIGDLNSAIRHWESAVKVDSENLDAQAELSKAYLQDGRFSHAMNLLEQATDKNPARADLWYLLAQAARYSSQLEWALECAEKARAMDTAAVQPLILCGEIALQMGNAALASQYAQQALAAQPANEAAILFMVKVHEWNNCPEEGLNLLEKSITPDSSVTVVLAYTRLVYYQRGAQAALPMLKKIAETDPDEVGVLNLLARAQEECGEFSGAEKTAYQALQLQPNQPEMNLLMGRLKRRDGQLDQSVHYLSEAIRQDVESVEGYLELGKTYVDRREMVQALHTYEKGIQANPSDHRLFYQAGIVLRESKDYVGSESMLRRAAELAPQDVNIRRLLGAVITLNLIHNSQEVGTINELQ